MCRRMCIPELLGCRRLKVVETDTESWKITRELYLRSEGEDWSEFKLLAIFALFRIERHKAITVRETASRRSKSCTLPVIPDTTCHCKNIQKSHPQPDVEEWIDGRPPRTHAVPISNPTTLSPSAGPTRNEEFLIKEPLSRIHRAASDPYCGECQVRVQGYLRITPAVEETKLDRQQVCGAFPGPSCQSGRTLCPSAGAVRPTESGAGGSLSPNHKAGSGTRFQSISNLSVPGVIFGAPYAPPISGMEKAWAWPGHAGEVNNASTRRRRVGEKEFATTPKTTCTPMGLSSPTGASVHKTPTHNTFVKEK